MQNALNQFRLLPNKLKSPWIIALIALCVGGAAIGLVWQQSQQTVVPSAQIDRQPAIATITALGKLQPIGEVIKLSAPTSANGNRVDRLLVKEGDYLR